MKKFLIIKGSAIGDIVQCLAVAAAIKTTCEDVELHWMVSKKFKGLLERNRFIDRILCYEDYKDLLFKAVRRIYDGKSNLTGIVKPLKFSVANKLKDEHYDVVINLHHKMDAKMFAVLCCSKQIIVPPFNSAEDGLLYNGNLHRVIDYLEVVSLLDKSFNITKFTSIDIDYGWHFTEYELSKTETILKSNGCDKKEYIVFVLGTTWESKNYPVENWISLTKLLVQSNKKVVFVGDEKDKKALNAIKQTIKNDLIVDLIGKTSLREMVMILAQATIVVGGDTGPMHIASSLGVKTITLMNPTYPVKFAPYGNKGIVLTANYPCKNCHFTKCPKGICCMKYIEPARVFESIDSVLQAADYNR